MCLQENNRNIENKTYKEKYSKQKIIAVWKFAVTSAITYRALNDDHIKGSTLGQ